MNVVVAAWSMVTAICFTLGFLNAAVWLRSRSSANGLFAVIAISTAVMSQCELGLMISTSVPEYSWILRWAHVPVFTMMIGVVFFIRVYFKAGRPWLGWAVCAVRGLSLVVDLLASENLNYTRIDSLTQIPFFGELVTIAHGERSPWMLLGQVSLLLLTLFIIDAAFEIWRRGEKRKALVAGSAFVFFIFLGAAQSAITLGGAMIAPPIPSVFFAGVVLVMGFELSRDMVRASELTSRLQEGEKRLALAAEAANLGVWSRESGREEIWASASWRTLFGFTESEKITIDKYLSRVHPEDLASVREILWHPNREDDRYELEYRALLTDGRVRWIASRGRFEPGGQGAATAVSVDITARKEAEIALHEQRTELAHLSRVAMLGELSGSLAHELNQPLTAILSNAQAAQRFLSQENFDRKEIEEILADIVAADQQAGEVIRSLRALFKKGETKQQPLNLNATITNVLKLVRSDLMNQHVVVETRLAEDAPEISADRVQIQQVLLNLILNAADAMSENDLKNRHLLVTTTSTAHEMRVSVRDNGHGLAPGMAEKIFEPFFTTKQQGLGLGLTVCRSILDGHESALHVSNHPEGGAEFSFSLKVASPTP